MDDLLKFFLGSAWLTALVFGLLRMSKGAIAVAVQQAGAREIERLKGELAKDLEKERQAFSREVERDRQAFERQKASNAEGATREIERVRAEVAKDLEQLRAAGDRALEQYRAELTLEAEVRRQVAARKVEAVLKISDDTIGLIRTLLDLDADHKGRYKALVAWAHSRVHADVLLSPVLRRHLREFYNLALEKSRVLSARELGQQIEAPEIAKAHADLEAAIYGLFEPLREEIEIPAKQLLSSRQQ